MIDELLPEAFAGERLDRVVAMLGDCSRSMATQLITAGRVRVDGRPVKHRSFRIEVGQRLEFQVQAVGELRPEPDDEVEFGIVHVDDDVIVIDKPPGLVVHPGAGRRDATLVNGLLARFDQLADVGDTSRPGIVHRLDAETSGLLVVARTDRAAAALIDDLRHHDVDRVYLAVVTGQVVDARGVIDAPIGRSSRQRTKMAVLGDGRPARTHYEVLDQGQRGEYTLLRCRLETGRTHQIRVHLAAIGHPVVGDRVYGPRVHHAQIDRVALHAVRLGFDHPGTGERVTFHAPTPDDFERLCGDLGLELSL